MNEEIKKLWHKWDKATNNRLSRVCLYSDDSGDFYDDEDNVLFVFENYEDLQKFFEDALSPKNNMKELPIEALDVKIDDEDFKGTIREFFKELAIMVWTEGEGFNGKRPFGNSGWSYMVYKPLIKEGMLKGELDEYGYLQDYDPNADKLIEKLLRDNF